MSEIQDFLIENKNWEDLLMRPPYSLKISRDDGYVSFMGSIESDFSIPLVQEAKGIILREDNFKVVCFPFKKIFNYNSSNCPEIDWSLVKAEEKIDGVLINVWWDNDWHVSTKYSIDAYKAKATNGRTFGDLFDLALKKDIFSVLDKDYTYMFELVSPYTQKIVYYPETELYYLGKRDNETFLEFKGHREADEFGCKNPEFCHFDHRPNAIDFAQTKGEGLIITDSQKNRCKIMNSDYVIKNFLRYFLRNSR